MSQQNIIFCDRCNMLQVKVRCEGLFVRWLTDDRNFYIGTEREAYEAGWAVLNGFHLCPRCKG